MNKVNGSCYIGSTVNLWNRLLDYGQPGYQVAKSETNIVKAIIKYGVENFDIIIISYVDIEVLRATEQAHITTYSPRYNIIARVDSSIGYTHSEESKKKISEAMLGKKWNEARRNSHSERQKGEKNSFYGRTHTDETKEKLLQIALARTYSPKATVVVEVYNTQTGETNIYRSMREASRVLKVTMYILTKYKHTRDYSSIS